jgi:Molybdenum cofactor biosynthesis enzyme
MLIDRYGREIRSLRVSITKRCNLDCIYCHNDGQPLEGKEELSVEAMTKICRVFNRLGVKKMKISGGEPLIREDCVEMISSLKVLMRSL